MNKEKKITRYTFIYMLLIIIFSSLIIKLADIQIVNGEEYKKLSQDLSIRTVDDDAARGKILDKNGIELATNKQSYIIFMMKPQNVKDEEEELNLVIERLIDILNSNNEKINDDFNISISKNENGESIFEYNFPNSYKNEEDINNYINRAARNWLKENNLIDKEDNIYTEKLQKVLDKYTDVLKDKSISENITAEQAFYYFKDRYNINPILEEHNNVDFIRKMIVVRQMMQERGYMAYKPVEIAYVSRDTAFEIMEKGMYLRGVDYKLKPVRTYPLGDLASTVIGSLRKIPSDKIQKYIDKHYNVNNDLIGRDGIEAYAEEYLRGDSGGRTVKIDANGRVVEELSKRDPIPGNDVILTIDSSLQKKVEESLDKVMEQLRNGEFNKTKYQYANIGAAVVIDVNTGEILSIASRPGGYDPNAMSLTGSIDVDTWKKLSPDPGNYKNEDPPSPIYNYATMGAVPPGSTFKIITAIAGLEEGAITANTKINCLGQYRVVNNFPGNCWIWNKYLSSHGNLDVIGAIQQSCNYFFFEVGRRVQIDSIEKYAKMFGLCDEPTGIEIDERPGNVADPEEIKSKAVNYATSMVLYKISQPDFDPSIEKFELTDTQKKLIYNMINNNDRDSTKLKEAGIVSYKMRQTIIEAVRAAYYEYNNAGIPLNAAIGQGEDRFTPLQIANYMATIANGGTRFEPHLIKKIMSPDGKIISTIEPEIINTVDISADTLKTIKLGMDKVTGDGGTAASVFNNFPIKTAGKTGTAEAAPKADYSWFAGFAPAENPQIAVAVVIYQGGGYGASNVARDIYEYYFKLNEIN